MSTQKNLNLLFIIDENSEFDSNTEALERIFSNVDKAANREEALDLYEANNYGIVLGDLSVEPERVGILKQLKDKEGGEIFFALVTPNNVSKLFGVADLGINAFELTPEQFDLALEEVAKFNP